MHNRQKNFSISKGSIHYTPGTIQPNNVSQLQMDSSVQAFYTNWKRAYIKYTAGDKRCYVFVKGKYVNKQSISEAQGYGMMIVALMGGNDAAARQTFDGLYNYYITHPSERSPLLMAWAQKKNLKSYSRSSATDGDMDIANALLLADAQWGSKGKVDYYTAAKKIVSAIAAQEINKATLTMLKSNSVEHDSPDYFDMRSSDFMPANLRAFAHVFKDSLWKKVIDSNYVLFSSLQKAYSDGTGLVPDFIIQVNKTARPATGKYEESPHDGDYDYNACRVPWRIATDYILYGDERSKAITEKINKWIIASTHGDPKNISSGYTLHGKAYAMYGTEEKYFDAMCFMSPFAVAAMTNADNQQWLNRLWSYMLHFPIGRFDYYNNTIKLLDMIIISGNYWAP